MKPFWKWGNYGFWYGHMQKCLSTRGLKGIIAADGKRDECIDKMYRVPNVYIIMSTANHVMAAATHSKQSVFHYDNDVGLACCSGLSAWKCWVKDCCGEHTGENALEELTKRKLIWRCMSVT